MDFGTPSCIAVELELEIEGYENKEIIIGFGEEESQDDINLGKFNIEAVEQSLRDTKNYWNNILRKVQVKTNEPDIDFMLNRMGYLSDNCM